MSEADKTIFISYRRSVSAFIARAIFQDLRANDYDVFMDVEAIDSGEFETIIFNQIAARAHFLIILTPGAVEACANPDDIVRREIECALDLQRNIVPILVNNFDFNDARQYLTGRLSRLLGYSGLVVPHEYFDEAMHRLRSRYLKQPVYGTITPAPQSEQQEVLQKIAEISEETTPTTAELSAEENFSTGVALYRLGDYEGAITSYTEAIRLNSDYARAFHSRGVAYAQLNDWEHAIEDYTTAIDLGMPDVIFAYANRGLAWRSRGDYEKALADYDEVIRLDPQSPTAYLNRGSVWEVMGDFDKALADYTEAARQDNLNVFAYFRRGGVYYDLGDFEKCIADLTIAIALRPDNAAAYNNRAEARFALGQYEQARGDFETAGRLDHNFEHAMAGLAITHHALGNLSEAKRLWKLLTRRDEKYWEINWVQKKLLWAKPLTEECRKLIARL